MKRALPWTMVLVRGVMGPGIVLISLTKATGWLLASVVIAMLLDDIADGMVARRFGVDTPRLRRADSKADTIFYLGVAMVIYLRVPHVMRANLPILVSLFSLEGLRYVLDLTKFGKSASYHSYLAKTWGLLLAVGVVCVLVSGGPWWVITIAATFGILVNLEGIAMSMMLPRWQNDVATLRVAARMRAVMLEEMRASGRD